MPIDPIHLQRRHAEQGRIRLGHKTGANGRPAKLETFRFTSPNRPLLDALAHLYGGEVNAWDNNGVEEFEVYSTTKSIPIVVVTGGVSQWFETWSRAGIGHRCDGTRSDKGVECDPHDPAHIEALKKPTTRLSVMLPELDSTGVWRMETHGWNAAAEIPMIGELAAHVGSMVPATLHLVKRRKVIQTQKGPQTSEFVVPVVDLEIKVRELAQLVSGTSPALIEAAPAPAPQIEAKGDDDHSDLFDLYGPQIAACATVDDVSALWRQIVANGHLYPPIRHALEDRGRTLTAATSLTEEESARRVAASNDEEVVEATLEPDEVEEPPVEDPPAREPISDETTFSDPIEDDRLWQDVMSAGARKKMTSMEIVEAYTQWAGHPVDQGNADLYRTFIQEKLS